jgi:hypothetical protein
VALAVVAILALGGAAVYFLAQPPQGPVVRPQRPDVANPADEPSGVPGEDVDLSGNKEPDPAGATPVASAASSVGAGTNTAPPSPEPLVGWEPPALAILLSGEQFGSIEPCGCSLKQLGGMSRRMDLVALLEKKGWPVIGFDLGGTLNQKRASRQQSKMKFEVTLSALKEMKYKALGMGREELIQGLELTTHHNPDELPFVCANARVAPADIGVPVPFRIVEAGGLKIAVTGIIGEKIRQAVIPRAPLTEQERGAGEIEAVPAAEGLKAVLPQMEAAKPDLFVLLSHGETEEGLELARLFPRFDLVLSAGGPDDPDPKPKYVGSTLVAQVGAKGKHSGVVGVYPQAEKKLRFELVDLEKDRFPGSPRMRELMKAYQDELLARNLAETESSVPHPTGNTYVGAKVCGKCHKKAFETWSASKHAHAYESLEKGRKGEEATWLSRVHDPECLACHVTGWQPQEVLRIDGGYTSMKATPHLAGQQCENCHGPGSQHSDLEKVYAKTQKITPELQAGRKSMNVSLATVELQVCTKCHDGDNSPTWNFAEFWPKVRHVGRD